MLLVYGNRATRELTPGQVVSSYKEALPFKTCLIEGYDGRTVNGGRTQVASLRGSADQPEEAQQLKDFLDAVEDTQHLRKAKMYKAGVPKITTCIKSIERFYPLREWPKESRELVLSVFLKNEQQENRTLEIHRRTCPYMNVKATTLSDPNICVVSEWTLASKATFFNKTYWRETFFAYVAKGKAGFSEVIRMCKFGRERYQTFDPLEADPSVVPAVKECLDLWEYVEMLHNSCVGAESQDKLHETLICN